MKFLKLSYTLIIISIISFLTSLVLFKYFNNYINFFSIILSILTFTIGIYWEKNNRKTAELFQDENRLQHSQLMDAIDKREQTISFQNKIIGDLNTTKTKLTQLMERVSIELGKEHFSKEEMLRKMDKPLFALLLQKTSETNMIDRNLKPLRDNILFSIGFKFIRGSRGMYLLPPSQMPSFKNRNEIESWVENKIIEKIPKKHRYVISFISLVDLRYTLSIRHDKFTKRYDTLLETVNSEELINFTEGLNYLHRKKDISLKELIDAPNFYFLSDKTSFNLKDKIKLKEMNEEILDEMKKYFGREIFTKDLPNIPLKELQKSLKECINISLEDIKIIKNNAKFWVDLFNNRNLLQ